MAKKTINLNIKQFDELSQESTAPVVHIAAEQNKENEAKETEPVVNSATVSPISSTPSQPLDVLYADHIAAQQAAYTVDENVKKRSIFTGKNFHNVDFEEDHELAMRICTAMTKTKFADIIRASVDEFLRRHYSEGRISQEGITIIQTYKDRTKV